MCPCARVYARVFQACEWHPGTCDFSALIKLNHTVAQHCNNKYKTKERERAFTVRPWLHFAIFFAFIANSFLLFFVFIERLWLFFQSVPFIGRLMQIAGALFLFCLCAHADVTPIAAPAQPVLETARPLFFSSTDHANYKQYWHLIFVIAYHCYRCRRRLLRGRWLPPSTGYGLFLF